MVKLFCTILFTTLQCEQQKSKTEKWNLEHDWCHLYQGCPELDFFNTVHVGVLRPHNLTQEQWCTYALRLCVRKYQIDKDFAATYSCVKTNG